VVSSCQARAHPSTIVQAEGRFKQMPYLKKSEPGSKVGLLCPRGTGFVPEISQDIYDEIVSGGFAPPTRIYLGSRSATLQRKAFDLFARSLPTPQNIRPDAEVVFAAILGPDIGSLYRFKAARKRVIVYAMDAWPRYHPRLHIGMQTVQPEAVFFSSRQVAKLFSEHYQNVFWLPEAINLNKYEYKPFNERSIDILSFGRKWDAHHEQIVEFCTAQKLRYLFEERKGQLIFEDSEFIDGLASSKICICVPSSLSHPERSGEIETTTMRYFQCMASRTIILGRAPQELIDWFGYNPVVEIDMDHPREQLAEILANPEKYLPLVNRNFERTLSNEGWRHRWSTINGLIEKNRSG
jgi:Glycosyl transferases group 1